MVGLISLQGLQVENLPPESRRIQGHVRANYPGVRRRRAEQASHPPGAASLNGVSDSGNDPFTSSAKQQPITADPLRGANPSSIRSTPQNEASLATRACRHQVTARLGLQVRRSSDDLLMVLSFSAPRAVSNRFLSGWFG